MTSSIVSSEKLLALTSVWYCCFCFFSVSNRREEKRDQERDTNANELGDGTLVSGDEGLAHDLDGLTDPDDEDELDGDVAVDLVSHTKDSIVDSVELFVET